MYHSRINYFSCSKLANYIRGTMKPFALEMEAWDEWHTAAKKKHPIRYWIVEEGFDMLQDTLNWPFDVYNSTRYYIRNRFVHQTHVMTSPELKAGEWCDLDTKLTETIFSEFVDFVEQEKAHMQTVWSKEDRKKYNMPWYHHGAFRFGGWRCAEAGIDYMKWEMSLINNEDMGYEKDHKDYGNPTYQAKNAKEQYEIYNWIKNVRPDRPDPYEVSGWNSLTKDKSMSEMFGKSANEDDRKIQTEAALATDKIEQSYHDEDTKMLVKIIKMRKSLWT